MKQLREETMTETTPNTHVDDKKLTERVLNALQGIEPLRVLGLPIGVRVSEGIVKLNGVVPTYSIKARVLDAARWVPGVKGVHNELLTDSDLETRIAHALSTDSRTHQAAFGIIINAINGFVSLVGRAPTWETAQTAEAIAAGVPGVRGVSNHLQIRPKAAE
jgi:osmotically-inducible protein OsmY